MNTPCSKNNLFVNALISDHIIIIDHMLLIIKNSFVLYFGFHIFHF